MLSSSTTKQHSDDQEFLSLQSVIGFTGSVVGGLHYTPCGKFAVFPLGSVVVLRALSSKKQFFLDAGIDKNVSCVAMSRDGAYLATGLETPASFKAEVVVWDLNKALDNYSKGVESSDDCILHVLSQHHKRVQAVDFSCDAQYITTLGGQDDNDIVVWDVATGVAICGSSASSECSHCIKWLNQRNDRFVTCGNCTLRVWQVCMATPKLHSIDVSMGSIRRVMQCLCISDDDSFAFAGNQTGEVLKFNIERDDIKAYNEPNIHHPTLSCYSKERFSKGVQSVACVVNPTTGNTNIIAGAGDGTVQIINPKLQRIPTHTVQVHGAATSIALHPDGKSFLVGTELSQRYSIDISTFTPELRETCHFGEIHDVRFPQRSSDIFITASEQDIRVWSAIKKRELLRINVPNTTCYAVDVTASGENIVSAWSDGKIRSFFPESGKLQFMIPDAHSDAVTSLAICNREESDGSTWHLVSGGKDGRVRFWRINETHQTMVHSMKEHRREVKALVCNADGSQVASASADGSCIIWDLQNGVRIHALYEPTVFNAVRYHPDESQYITGSANNKIGFWDAYDGSPIRFITGGDADVTCLDIHSNGTYFLSGGADKKVNVWHYDNGKKVAFGKGHSGRITKVAISPDQQSVVSVGSEGGIFIWNICT
jgi:WD40 repeat protein|eukprot:g597.t1 g597   contig10:361023-362987(+)